MRGIDFDSRPGARRCTKASVRLASAAAFTALLAPPQLRSQHSQFERDFQFTNALSALHFSELAWSEFEQLRQRYAASPHRHRLDNLEVDLLLGDARFRSDPEERRLLFEEALTRATKLAQNGSAGPSQAAADLQIADLAIEFLDWLGDAVAQARTDDPTNDDPRQVNQLVLDARTILLAGIKACDAVMAELASRRDHGGLATATFHLARLRRGMLYGKAAKAMPADGPPLRARSLAELEYLALDVGENTLLGLIALFELAHVAAAEGVNDDAIRGYLQVIAAAQAMLGPYADAPVAVSESVFDILEAAYERIASLHFAAGRHDQVAANTEDYRRTMGQLGVPLTDLQQPKTKPGGEGANGHLIYVAQARSWARNYAQEEAALRLATSVSEWHPEDFVGARAQSAVAEIQQRMPQSRTARTLLLAAQGEHRRQRFEEAVKLAKRALTAADLDDGAAVAAHATMAASMARQQRFLEATLALQRGLALHATRANPDSCRAAADALHMAVQQLRAQTRDDPFFDGLVAQAFTVIARHGTTTEDTFQWREAMRRLGDQDRPRAVAAFARIAADSALHPMARARIAATLWCANDARAARATLAECRQNMPGNAEPAVAGTVDFCEACLLHDEASAAGATNATDLQRRIVELLKDFENRYGQHMATFVPEVRFLLGNAHVETGNPAAARLQLELLRGTEPRLGSAGFLAAKIFSALLAEATVAADATTTTSTAAGVAQPAPWPTTSPLPDRQRAAASFGIECAARYDDWPYACGLLTLHMLEALGDWARIESLGRNIAERFTADNERAQVDHEVLPILGNALLRSRKFAEAHEVLVRAEAADPGNYPVKRLLCFALGGYTDLDRLGRVHREPGLGRAVEAYLKYTSEYRIYGLNRDRGVEPFSLAWFEFQWECYMFALGAAAIEPKYQERARELFATVSQNGLAALERQGQRATEISRLFLANPPPGR